MPYIKNDDRSGLIDNDEWLARNPQNGGELNFLISTIIGEYILDNGLCYAKISDVIGALEGAKAEFQRRIVGPYENLKLIENGDLPEYEYITKAINLQS